MPDGAGLAGDAATRSVRRDAEEQHVDGGATGTSAVDGGASGVSATDHERTGVSATDAETGRKRTPDAHRNELGDDGQPDEPARPADADQRTPPPPPLDHRPAAGSREERRSLDRSILALAVPALGALIAEPLFVLTDTALVGHLGPDVLAGLGIASTVLQTVIGLMVFLAYTTTPIVARLLGSGDRRGAIHAGIEGMWLGLGAGVLIAVAGVPLTPLVVSWFTTDPAVAAAAVTYLAVSLAGIPAMLLVIAATGLFRGLQDTRTPLVVAIGGFTANALLNALLIYGLGLGIGGSALGTVLAQWGMAVVLAWIAVRAARRERVSLRPGVRGRGATLRASGWMILRTVTLRAAIVSVVWTCAQLGASETAALQVQFAIYNLVVFALDALAIAGQALVGHGLGAGDTARVRRVLRRLVLWGLGFSALLGVALLAGSPVIGRVFTNDPAVLALVPGGIVALALTMPVAAYTFVLDGVLIGAGDARYLALVGVANLVVLLALLAVIRLVEPSGWVAMLVLWLALAGGFNGSRAVTLWLRQRGTAWMVTGATR
ncbi:MATE family efflux transporter [Pseudoclavibacter chungangensis]|uniref:MATE family efflux transporter n=2 Tax=Pseudoclavibacter chungangensis TaxID=587635 RepID=A0A7J5BPA9_9MICO|nr:MATE family efflux transporter [Pseudoclavibacter chungangensis]